LAAGEGDDFVLWGSRVLQGEAKLAVGTGDVDFFVHRLKIARESGHIL